MSLRLQNLQRSTVAFLGAVACTMLLVVASAPSVPLV